MRAISIRQPWAWAIIYAGKDVENRTESAAKRMRNGVGERILIHASRSIMLEDFGAAAEILRRLSLGSCPDFEDFQCGGVIGTAVIAEIIDPAVGHKSPWYTGRSGLILTDAKPCYYIGMKGQLGIYGTDITRVRYK